MVTKISGKKEEKISNIIFIFVSLNHENILSYELLKTEKRFLCSHITRVKLFIS